LHKYIRNTYEGRIEKMSKVVSVRFENLEFERLEKMAKLAGKNIAQFVREKIRESIQQEMKETSLLERLIKMIESLQNFQQQNTTQNTAQRDSEILREIYKLLIYLAWHEKTVAELTIIMEQKRKEYMQKRQEIEQKLGLEF
jgi:predicted DNA-binding protein